MASAPKPSSMCWASSARMLTISTKTTSVLALVFRNAAYINGPLTMGCLNHASNIEANK
jgi:hypothetical protein